MKAEEILLDNGYEGVKYLTDYSYDDAIIGVSSTDQVVYDFDKMVEYLMREEELDELSAIEWIEYNTIRALPYMSPGEPIVMRRLYENN